MGIKMFSYNNWTATMLILLGFLIASHLNTGEGQSQNAIGAHRAFQKTSFSCSGRPSGYYADVETGCQVYHMCDSLGRQFSYSCPNTTLFQQRMLICDHWYMVNCSKAESDYAANLLIGQRDKPFVNDEENSLRTPRPDLLDRPYAPDYSGESFRTQYKQLPAVRNQIIDSDAGKSVDKMAEASHLAPGQQHWKIPSPSRNILPPAYEPEAEIHTHDIAHSDRVRFVTTPAAKPSTTRTPTTARAHSPKRTTASTTPSTRNLRHPQRHKQSASADDHEDLGTSHSTRYNTSADFNSAEQRPSNKPTRTFSSSSPAKPITVKIPSKIYEPPLLYPIYNQENITSTAAPSRASSATPFTAPLSRRTTSTITTTRSPTRPTTLAGKPFTPSLFPTSTSAAPQIFTPTSILQPQTRTPTPAHGFRPPTPRPRENSEKTLSSRNTGTAQISASHDFLPSDKPIEPVKDLLPPYQEFVQHDIATTQGPPIYYEWKVPSHGLEPPKLDPPIGVDGREYPDSAIDYNAIKPIGTLPPTTFNFDQQTPATVATKKSYDKNPFLMSKQQSSVEDSTKTPTSRSVKDTAQPSDSSDITKLRQDLSVPEFLFPLEDIGRTGYLASDTYNSFQLKIPELSTGMEKEPQHWFGENPKCPECHPSYVKPGTCEPCLRR